MNPPMDVQKYHFVKYFSFFVGLFIDLVFLMLFFYSGLSFQLKQLAGQLSSNVFLINSVYLVVFSIIWYFLHLPMHFFISYSWEHKFNLSNQKINGWLIDELKRIIFGFILMFLLVQVAYIFLENFSTRWWILTGIFWITFSFILARLTPTVIVPLFYKYLPIENKVLKEKIFDLFRKCNTSLKDVYAINFSSKTKKANAFICGLGKSRRVVLSDTLLEKFSDNEIETVIAHELGHYKHKDILKLLIVNAFLIFTGLFLINKYLQYAVSKYQLIGLHDISFLPMICIAFNFFGLILTPVLNVYSCHMERKADQFSLDLTSHQVDFISMMKKLGEMNLAEFKPSKFTEIFFYDHPPIAQRIEAAQLYKVRI